MTLFAIPFPDVTKVMLYQETKELLRNLSFANRDVHWIQSDLTLKERTCISDLFWKIIGCLNFLREAIFGINLDTSAFILSHLKNQIASTEDLELKTIFNAAVAKFNSISKKINVSGITIEESQGLVERQLEEAPTLIEFQPMDSSFSRSLRRSMTSTGGQRFEDLQYALEQEKLRRSEIFQTQMLKYPEPFANKKVGNTNIILMTGNIGLLKLGTQGTAVVNAANSTLSGGTGVDQAIHEAAGESELKRACAEILRARQGSFLPISECVETPAFKMDAQYIIHTVGPRKTDSDQDQLIEATYVNILQKAKELGIKKIALPAISIGAFGVNPKIAAPATIRGIESFLSKNPDCFDEILFVFFNQEKAQEYVDALGLPRSAS